MRRVRIAAFALLLAHTSLIAQQPTAASVDGIVVNATSGDPLAKVTVELRGPQGATLLSTQTDADGKFHLLNALPGRYRLVATRASFVKAEYGQRSANGAGLEFALAAGQRINDVRLRMTAGASIAGIITEKGQPVGI